MLGTSSGTASLAAGMVGIAYAIFAIPSGKVAHRFGRKKTIRVSLALLVAVTVLVSLRLSLSEGIRNFKSFSNLCSCPPHTHAAGAAPLSSA